MNPLRALDERLLPGLARGAQRTADVIAAGPRALVGRQARRPQRAPRRRDASAPEASPPAAGAGADLAPADASALDAPGAEHVDRGAAAVLTRDLIAPEAAPAALDLEVGRDGPPAPQVTPATGAGDIEGVTAGDREGAEPDGPPAAPTKDRPPGPVDTDGTHDTDDTGDLTGSTDADGTSPDQADVPAPVVRVHRPGTGLATAPRSSAAAPPAQARRAGRLARLDRRLTARGPLGFVRELPQVGLVVVGAVLVAGTLSAVRVDADRASSTPAGAGGAGSTASVAPTCPVGRAAGSAFVGPDATTALPQYTAQAAQVLSACDRASPNAQLFAVVSLSSAENPATAAVDLRAVTLLQAFVQLPADPASPRVLGLTGASDGSVKVEAALDAAFATAQAAFLADRTDQLTFADSVTATTPVEVAGKADAEAAAASDELSAGELRTECSCIYGAVAFGSVANLAALATSDVRVIALAPAGTDADGLTARPLLPSETATLGKAAAPTPVVAGDIE